MQRIAFAIVLAVYLALAAQYAALTPDWQAPDEPAHYNVVRQIAQGGALPQLEPGDYDQAFLEQVVGAGFPPRSGSTGSSIRTISRPFFICWPSRLFGSAVGHCCRCDWSRCSLAPAP